MANWVMLNQQEAGDMFAEATGALGIQVNYGKVAEVLNDHTRDIHNVALPANERNTLARALQKATVASLGTYCFVYPYERYKKIASAYPDRHLDPSRAFDLDRFSDRDTFHTAYPKTVIHTWIPDNNARTTWFADVVRNSFAHAQSDIVIEGGQIGVALTNTKDGKTVNFDIVMTMAEFERLMASSLNNFVRTVVTGGVYQPLSKLVEVVRA